MIIVGEVEDLHRLFANALRTAYGKVPIAGIPRITRMRKGQSRRASSDATEGTYEDGPDPESGSKLALAARAELAVALGEVERAHALSLELRQIRLSESEREELREELDAADKLERSQR